MTLAGRGHAELALVEALASDPPQRSSGRSRVPCSTSSVGRNEESETTAARALAAALEPVAGQVHFSPECHAEYVALGFDPSPGMAGTTHLPDRTAYFTSRGSVMGQVRGDVVAAAFAVFNPAVVVPAVEVGWALTDAHTIRAARQRGAVAQLRRILGDEPAGARRAGDLLVRALEPLRVEGRPLFAGQRAEELPDEPLARLWRAADALREYRGDSHVITWVGAGLDPAEIGMLSDLYWGSPPRGHTGGRGWSESQMEEAFDRLRGRGLVEGDELSTAGFELRDSIERRTDAHVRPAVAALGDDLDELVAILTPWGDLVRSRGGYLSPAVRFTWLPG